MVLRVRVERGVESALPHRDVVGRSPPDHVPYRTAPARRDMLGWVPELEGEKMEAIENLVAEMSRAEPNLVREDARQAIRRIVNDLLRDAA